MATYYPKQALTIRDEELHKDHIISKEGKGFALKSNPVSRKQITPLKIRKKNAKKIISLKKKEGDLA